MKTVTARFMEENRLMINMESRILGDEYVRFGGERLGRFHIFIWFRTFRLACGFWNNSYLISELEADRMVWTVLEDAEDVSVYVRCEKVPEDIMNGTRAIK